MSGPVVLHGGGEFLPGDEPAITAMLELAEQALGRTGRRGGPHPPIRVAVVPTAAARGRPDLAAVNGVAAFERVAADRDLDIALTTVRIVDEPSAADPALAAILADSDLVAFPGGDPDLIPTLFLDSPAWAAVESAHRGGAVLAGASAGAMALGSWTWTPAGGQAGLGVIRDLTVMPHADEATWQRSVARFGPQAPHGISALGLGERTAVVIVEGEPWRVVGPGEARWLPFGAQEPVVAFDGDTIVP